MQVFKRDSSKMKRERGMKMKKYLSLLLAVLMTASLLAGCGGDTAADDSAADDTAATETEDTGAASTGSGVELKLSLIHL